MAVQNGSAVPLVPGGDPGLARILASRSAAQPRYTRFANGLGGAPLLKRRRDRTLGDPHVMGYAMRTRQYRRVRTLCPALA